MGRNRHSSMFRLAPGAPRLTYLKSPFCSKLPRNTAAGFCAEFYAIPACTARGSCTWRPAILNKLCRMTRRGNWMASSRELARRRSSGTSLHCNSRVCFPGLVSGARAFRSREPARLGLIPRPLPGWWRRTFSKPASAGSPSAGLWGATGRRHANGRLRKPRGRVDSNAPRIESHWPTGCNGPIG